MRETLHEAMDPLEANDRIILWLLYWEHYSMEDTAAIMGYSPGNVRVRAGRARALLHQQMDSSAGDEDSMARFAPSMCRPSQPVLHA